MSANLTSVLIAASVTQARLACTNCGAGLPASARFCSSCGTQV